MPEEIKVIQPNGKEKKLSLQELNFIPKGDAGLNDLAYNNEEFSTEYDSRLQGRQGSINYSKMSRSDDQVGMILNVYKNPIKSANWGFPKGEDISANDEKAIDALNEWYFSGGYKQFSELLPQIISCLEFGFSSFERVWTPTNINGSKLLMPDLQQRLQMSIQHIYPDRGYLQQSTKAKGTVDIPLDNMVFFTLNKQGNDMRGVSILRHAFVNWVYKNRYRTYEGIGIQRSQTGIPVLIIPEGTDPEGDEYTAVETLLTNITTHEDAYMILTKEYEFDIKSFKNDPDKIQNVIDKLDTKMAISVLAQFVLLGTNGGGGAYALSRDQSDMLLDGLNYIVTFIEQVFHSQVIMPFLELNYGKSVDPENVRLRGLNLNKKAGKELAETLKQLSEAGFIKATLEDEKQMRQYLEMPPLSDEEIAKREEYEKVSRETNTNNNEPVKLSEKSKSQRQKDIDREQKQLKDVMQANLLLIKDKLMADISKVLNSGSVEIKGLKNIEVSWSKYQKNLERKLAGIAQKGWNDAKKDAKKNIKLSDPQEASKISDPELQQYVKNQASYLAEDQTVGMKTRAIATASNSPLKGYSVSQTLSNVDREIDNYIDGQKVLVGASLATVGSLNFGETQLYKEVEEELWGYEFIAVDDGNTSEICKWYSGKTFSKDSTELTTATPPLHPNCRSYLQPIYKSRVKNKPKIDDVVAPPSIQKQKSVF